MIEITLAGPPRGKGRPRSTIAGKHVRVYTDAETVKYETQLRYAAEQAMAGRVPLEGPLHVEMLVRFPIPKAFSKKKRSDALDGERTGVLPIVKPDADNTLKLSDALQEIIFRDDKQIVDVRVLKRYSERPGLTIKVWEWAEVAAF